MNEYKVEFSYLTIGNRRITEIDVGCAWRLNDRVEDLRAWYAGLPGWRVERVYIDNNGEWEVCKNWEY
nr:MAG TPA: hypothetical protein [Caudoviricetes sp.]